MIGVGNKRVKVGELVGKISIKPSLTFLNDPCGGVCKLISTSG